MLPKVSYPSIHVQVWRVVFFIERKSDFSNFVINQSYQAICEKHPSFRERSENVDLVVEISLQPWKVFKPDGVMFYSSTHFMFLCSAAVLLPYFFVLWF